MPASSPAASASSVDDLAPGGAGPLRVGGRLAVHAQVRRRLLDEPVRLAGDDERVLGQADVQRLPAPAQREQDALRSAGSGGGDRHRALERGDRRPERLVDLLAGGEAPRDERRDDLGVGRHLGRDVESLDRLEVGVVVDVAVERPDDVRPVGAPDLLAVDGVRIGFRDDADARPPGVRQDDGLGRSRLRPPGAGGRRRGSLSAAWRCCRRARRSRRPPCTRSSGSRRRGAPPGSRTTGRAARRAGAAIAGSSRSSPW